MNKYFFLILLFLSLGFGTGCNRSGIHKSPASSRGYNYKPGIFKDAFKRKPKRRRNVNSTRPRPFFARIFGNKKKLHKFRTSRKEKRKRKSFFKRKRVPKSLKKKSGGIFGGGKRKSKGAGRKGKKKGGLFKSD